MLNVAADAFVNAQIKADFPWPLTRLEPGLERAVQDNSLLPVVCRLGDFPMARTKGTWTERPASRNLNELYRPINAVPLNLQRQTKKL